MATTETERRIAAPDLQAFAFRVLEEMGADPDVAAETAEHLIGANLAGHDSHGMLRLPQYVESLDKGSLAPGARGRPLKKSPSLLLYDAELGLGQWSTRQALDWCLEHAATAGIAAAAIRHSTHAGRLGHYAEIAARQGFVSIITLGQVAPNAAIVAPFGGTGRVLGTNPWCFGVPAAGRAPFLADFATSQVAEGKVQVARYEGHALAEGLVVDREGRPTTNPQDLYDGGALVGLGGAQTGHKGYGLGMAAALIGGLAEIGDSNATAAGALLAVPQGGPWLAGVFLQVLDPAWFGGAEAFVTEVSKVLAATEAMPPAPGRDEVLVPGDPEARNRAERLATGIPLPDRLWVRLEDLSTRFGVPLPSAGDVSGTEREETR